MAGGSLCGGSQGCSYLLLLLLLLLLGVTSVLGAMLPPRLSSHQTTVTLQEGQEGFSLECDKDLGDDPIKYRWLKDHKIVTAVLGYAYRGYNKVILALHKIEPHHAGTYVCEASNSAGVDSAAIRVIVENEGRKKQQSEMVQPHTDEILSEIATSLSDVLAEGECKCDTMFFLHVTPDAPDTTLAVQANLVHTIADQIISETNRVSIVTYSDYTLTKLSLGTGTNKCALKNAFKDLTHEKWPTRLQPVLREAFKKFKKSKSNCKVLFLPIFGSVGTEGVDIVGAQHLKKLGVKIFILEVTPVPVKGVTEMASERGDGYPYHWRVPQSTWPTIVINMNTVKEVVGCMHEEEDIPGKCVSEDSVCTNDTMCRGVGYGCEEGRCVFKQCNINPREPGCCSDESRIDRYWCGDVTGQCIPKSNICDGIVQCMNGADEKRCWLTPCLPDKIARCQTSTLCLDLMDLCNGEPACPGGEDEDPRFCRSFPCPRDRSFRCRSGKCIAKEKLCDGVFRDCDEGEDEVFEYCKSVHVCPPTRSFKCDYGICNSDRVVCDGTFNCLDATDELVCDKKNCPAQRPFKCLSGLCISMDQVCNGVRDGCGDGSDELNCANVTCPVNRNFKCTNGICLDGGLRCDGRRDCADGSDEENCPTTPPPPPPPPAPTPTQAACPRNMFKCNDGACVRQNRVCNGKWDCLSGEDEDRNMCLDRKCHANRPYKCKDGTCVLATAPCNGIEDCPDGSDEINCTQTHTENEDDFFEEDDATTKPPAAPTTGTTEEPVREVESVEETFIEEEMPNEQRERKDDVEEMEAVEVMVETEAEEGGEPAASSEQGVGKGTCVTPAFTLLLVPLFSLCNVRIR